MPYTLSIPTTTTSTTPKPYTIYNLTISTPLRTQVLPKRYTDFVNLHRELTRQVGGGAQPPPVALPGKTWFGRRTVNDAGLTEERRVGLEGYVRGVEGAGDGRWRDSSVWKGFLGIETGGGGGSGAAGGGKMNGNGVVGGEGMPKKGMSSQEWLSQHAQLKQYIQESRMCLTRRDQASTATQQHEASAQAKKWLVKAHTLILKLEDGLNSLQHARGGSGGGGGGGGGDRLGEGEIRRRRDLLTRARKEREALEGVCSSWTISGTRDAANGFSSKASSSTNTNANNNNNTSHPSNSNFPTKPSASGRRILGGPPAPETDRTRELDNAGILQLQQKVMQEQDMDVDELAKVVRRMKDMGIAINDELVEQGEMLTVLDDDVDRVGAKIGVAKKRLRKIK